MSKEMKMSDSQNRQQTCKRMRTRFGGLKGTRDGKSDQRPKSKIKDVTLISLISLAPCWADASCAGAFSPKYCLPKTSLLHLHQHSPLAPVKAG